MARPQSFHRVLPTQPTLPTLFVLVSELNDPSPVVRENAATEIGQRGLDAFDAIDDLKRLAESDPDEDVRRISRMALFNVRGGDQRAPWEVLGN
jgi:hypothetical protein